MDLSKNENHKTSGPTTTPIELSADKSSCEEPLMKSSFEDESSIPSSQPEADNASNSEHVPHSLP